MVVYRDVRSKGTALPEHRGPFASGIAFVRSDPQIDDRRLVFVVQRSLWAAAPLFRRCQEGSRIPDKLDGRSEK